MKSRFQVAGEDRTLGLPYAASEETVSGQPNIGYINLVREPHRRSEFPELAGFPEFEACIDLIIAPDSIFTSLRIGSYLDLHADAGYAHSCFTFVTLMFIAPPGDDLDWFKFFYQDFVEQAARNNISDRFRTSFIVVPIEIESMNFKGIALDIQLCGDGNTPADARTQWAEGITALNESIVRWDELAKERGITRGALPT